MCAWFFFASLFFCYQLHVFIRRDSTIYLHYCSSIFWRTGRKWDPLTDINQPFSPTSTNHSHPAASQCSRYVCALCVVAEQPSSLKIYLSAYLSVRAAIKRALRSSVSGFKQSKCGERERERCDVMDFKCLSQESSHSLQYNFFLPSTPSTDFPHHWTILRDFSELSLLLRFFFFACLYREWLVTKTMLLLLLTIMLGHCTKST